MTASRLPALLIVAIAGHAVLALASAAMSCLDRPGSFAVTVAVGAPQRWVVVATGLLIGSLQIRRRIAVPGRMAAMFATVVFAVATALMPLVLWSGLVTQQDLAPELLGADPVRPLITAGIAALIVAGMRAGSGGRGLGIAALVACALSTVLPSPPWPGAPGAAGGGSGLGLGVVLRLGLDAAAVVVPCAAVLALLGPAVTALPAATVHRGPPGLRLARIAIVASVVCSIAVTVATVPLSRVLGVESMSVFVHAARAPALVALLALAVGLGCASTWTAAGAPGRRFAAASTVLAWTALGQLLDITSIVAAPDAGGAWLVTSPRVHELAALGGFLLLASALSATARIAGAVGCARAIPLVVAVLVARAVAIPVVLDALPTIGVQPAAMILGVAGLAAGAALLVLAGTIGRIADAAGRAPAVEPPQAVVVDRS